MERVAKPENDDTLEKRIQENIAKWQLIDNPIAPLSDEQKEVLYNLSDLVKDEYTLKPNVVEESKENIIYTQEDYVKWLVKVENEIRDEHFYRYSKHLNHLKKQSEQSVSLYNGADDIITDLENLQLQYQQVTTKTDSLHNLSEQLMFHQNSLKEKKDGIAKKLKYFTLLNTIQDNIVSYSSNVNGKDFINMLDQIDESIEYMTTNINYKEAYVYKIKFENLLNNVLGTVLKYVNHVVTEATNQVIYLDNKANLLIGEGNQEPNVNAAFSFYYGKFQNAAKKVSNVLAKIESKIEKNELYSRTYSDCQRAYFAQRVPLITNAVVKALNDLKERHKSDHSILFRSSSLFIIKVCQDESTCYHYFFTFPSQQLQEYLAAICQNLYDILRPSLITINHLEVLTELCTILKEMLNVENQNNVALDQFMEITNQLLQDVAERLVFRANVFFQHDLNAYVPSPGDLAYPEKLEHMENVVEEISERRPSSRSSVLSLESQEVANINSNYQSQFRSYTGNSPADLHGMWYPTVKRALVCLSRLYFCLEREIFQGLAQEALLICGRTIEQAAAKIADNKSPLHGKLFQIKHLLIIREQIAPFQVDFTVKEMSIDFSNIKSAAAGLIQNRNKLFSFSSNNALLEFLLEGTPKVKEYLIDSRKEIDKQLKLTCEAFITYATESILGSVMEWVHKAEHILKITNMSSADAVPLPKQEFGKPQNLADIVNAAKRNIKAKLPEIKKYMKLYLANRETEFILFRPILNNMVNIFGQLEQLLATAKYSEEDLLVIACPTLEQINILICYISMNAEQESDRSFSRQSSVQSNVA